jgi:hypothetical protein
MISKSWEAVSYRTSIPCPEREALFISISYIGFAINMGNGIKFATS